MATQAEYESAMFDAQIELAKIQVEQAKVHVKKTEHECQLLKADLDIKEEQLKQMRNE